MPKTLLVFLQSNNLDVYVNIISHCVLVEEVSEVYFAADEQIPGRLSEAEKTISGIRGKIEVLTRDIPLYQPVLGMMPIGQQLRDRVLRVSFVRPEVSIPMIKRRLSPPSDLLVDISCCNKRLSSDIIASFLPNGLKHVCYFELEDQVYATTWIRSKLFHDIKPTTNMRYYTYVDFSEAGTTINSYNRMRKQGVLIKFLLSIAAILSLIVFALIQQQQATWAQLATLLLTIVAGVGLVNDVFGLKDHFLRQ